MSTGVRPFEEIKRMRLSQALDSDSMKAGLAASPTLTTGARAPLEGMRPVMRFPPGNRTTSRGVKTGGANVRPSAGAAGFREMGFTRQPLSPALTAPPTPPPSRMDWKMHEGEASTRSVSEGHTQFRTTEHDNVVLPMEQRPPDEVNAVQALMSVGRGARTQPSPASMPEAGDNESVDADGKAGEQTCEVCYSMITLR